MTREREESIATALIQEIKVIPMGKPNLGSIQCQHTIKIMDDDLRVIAKALRAYLRRAK